MTDWRAIPPRGSENGLGAPRLLGVVIICAVVLVLAGCTVLIPHTVSTPDSPSIRPPTDSTTGKVGQLMFFVTRGAACSKGHSVQHQWDWGDRTYSEWLDIESWFNTWDSPGTYEVKVRARCAQNPTVLSAWSDPLTVTIPPSPLPPPPPPPPPLPPPPLPEPDPITFSGIGDHATAVFQLTSGLAKFEFTHHGSSNFIVWLYNSTTGAVAALLVNEIGAYSGTTAEGLESGTYLLNIRADGAWTARITQPRPISGEALPVRWTGRGDSVLGPVHLPSGLARFELQYTGDSNFIIQLYHYASTGQVAALIVNEIGNYSGSQVVQIREAGLYYVCVVARGAPANWSIGITR